MHIGCTAAFLDVSQAFDKLWHADLLHKFKSCFLSNLYNNKIIFSKNLRSQIWRNGHAIKEYQRWNFTRQSVRTDALFAITADLPLALGTTTATYADDTAILTNII